MFCFNDRPCKSRLEAFREVLPSIEPRFDFSSAHFRQAQRRSYLILTQYIRKVYQSAPADPG